MVQACLPLTLAGLDTHNKLQADYCTQVRLMAGKLVCHSWQQVQIAAQAVGSCMRHGNQGINSCSQSRLMAGRHTNQVSTSCGSIACVCCRKQAHHCRGELEVGVLLTVQVPCNALSPALKQMLPMKVVLRSCMHPLLSRLAALGGTPSLNSWV